MSVGTLVLALDAVESTVLDELMAEGRLRAIARARDQGASARLRPESMDTLPGAIWEELSTGVSVGRHGNFYPLQIPTGERLLRTIPEPATIGLYRWYAAAEQGARTLVVDQPLVPDQPPVDGLTVVREWHVHDQHWGRSTSPPDLLVDLETRYSARPVDRCDFVDTGSFEGVRRFREQLLGAADEKAEVVLDLLGREHWDLAWIVFSEGHCAGHQLWNHHDPTSPWHRTDTPADVRGALADVYEHLDHLLERIIDEVEPDAVVIVASHGMGHYIGGPQLLPEILRRLGMGDHRNLPTWLRPLVPLRAIQRAFRRSRRFREDSREWSVRRRGFVRPGIKALVVPNNRVGAIRLNLVGREPEGEVRPDEAAGLLDELEAELRALVDPNTGRPVVVDVIRTEEHFGADHHPDLPDLLVQFVRDQGSIVEVEGPRTGRTHVEFQRIDYPRTGDHTDRSRLWAYRPGVAAPGDLGDVLTLDVAPSILGALGLDPGDVDGRPHPGVVSSLRPSDAA